jgi:hypothetical protein
VISSVPSQAAPRIAARWETDLSAGAADQARATGIFERLDQLDRALPAPRR